MGDDQNYNNLFISHLLNLLFQRFVFRNAKNIDFCVKKRKYDVTMM